MRAQATRGLSRDDIDPPLMAEPGPINRPITPPRTSGDRQSPVGESPSYISPSRYGTPDINFRSPDIPPRLSARYRGFAQPSHTTHSLVRSRNTTPVPMVRGYPPVSGLSDLEDRERVEAQKKRASVRRGKRAAVVSSEEEQEAIPEPTARRRRTVSRKGGK